MTTRQAGLTSIHKSKRDSELVTIERASGVLVKEVAHDLACRWGRIQRAVAALIEDDHRDFRLLHGSKSYKPPMGLGHLARSVSLRYPKLRSACLSRHLNTRDLGLRGSPVRHHLPHPFTDDLEVLFGNSKPPLHYLVVASHHLAIRVPKLFDHMGLEKLSVVRDGGNHAHHLNGCSQQKALANAEIIRISRH